MMKTFENFFVPGEILELGSYTGEFTRLLCGKFSRVTCIEASLVAINEAKRRLQNNVDFIHARFEDAVVPRKFHNIVMTHVLEHLDDPVAILKKVNSDWLAESGRLIVACPNANAPSRQIAVYMGLLSNVTDITSGEYAHGHRRTYTLEVLENHAKAAGLNVTFRSGIFFKALANFQWDEILHSDFISKEFLEGCFVLGQHYPELCATIYLVCERGD